MKAQLADRRFHDFRLEFPREVFAVGYDRLMDSNLRGCFQQDELFRPSALALVVGASLYDPPFYMTPSKDFPDVPERRACTITEVLFPHASMTCQSC